MMIFLLNISFFRVILKLKLPKFVTKLPFVETSLTAVRVAVMLSDVRNCRTDAVHIPCSPSIVAQVCTSCIVSCYSLHELPDYRLPAAFSNHLSRSPSRQYSLIGAGNVIVISLESSNVSKRNEKRV